MDEFFTILHGQNIDQLVDVRSLPQSRHNPSYNNRNTLSLVCNEKGIAYTWFGYELVGLRSEQPGFRHALSPPAALPAMPIALSRRHRMPHRPSP